MCVFVGKLLDMSILMTISYIYSLIIIHTIDT